MSCIRAFRNSSVLGSVGFPKDRAKLVAKINTCCSVPFMVAMFSHFLCTSLRRVWGCTTVAWYTGRAETGEGDGWLCPRLGGLAGGMTVDRIRTVSGCVGGEDTRLWPLLGGLIDCMGGGDVRSWWLGNLPGCKGTRAGVCEGCSLFLIRLFWKSDMVADFRKGFVSLFRFLGSWTGSVIPSRVGRIGLSWWVCDELIWFCLLTRLGVS